MALTEHIPPYEWSDDFGPDDLSDVDLNHPKFRAAFPDGKVPIRHVPTLGFRSTDLHEWASELLARFEYATSRFDVDRLEALRSALITHMRQGARDATHWNAARQTVVEMLLAGLTLRMVHRYVEVPLSDVVWIYTLGSHSYHYSLAEPFAAAHDLLVETDLSQAEIARRTGCSRKSVMRLAAHTPVRAAADNCKKEVAA